jgi:KUP system potassium uptake protein
MNSTASASPKRTAFLAMGALGVVFGDIGTSPLYSMRECLHGPHGVAATHDHVLGILSLIIWSLTTLITVKYISVVMRADNEGEGGMLALLALGFSGMIRGQKSAVSRTNHVMVVLALLGTSFLFGEGIITPAISVLSAVEGLKVAAPGMDAWIVPITVVILLVLFSLQHRGTGKMGVMFGPVTLIWFIVIGVLGIRGILMNSDVLNAFNPWFGAKFIIENKLHSAMTLGGVFLVVTGGEALYADMGHFGRQPIRYAWFAVVMPALLLNYLGQGALVLSDPSQTNLESPFHRLAPAWFSLPLVILGAMAAVIASQALISGAFSLATQAVQMGFIPRLRIEHTSEHEHGQIFAAPINRAIMVGSISLVLMFETSSNLAAAYGIAVSLTMLITSILLSQIAVRCWNWPVWKSAAICGSFMLIEISFVSANLTKVMQGGFVPLAIGAALLFTMLTWKRGRDVLSGKFADMSLPLEDLVDSFKRHAPVRVRGTAVFLTASPVATPGALLHNLKHNKILHEKVVVLSLQTQRVPRVKPEDSIKIVDLGSGIWRVISSHGFMEQPDVPSILTQCAKHDLEVDPNQTSYFLGRETIVPTRKNMPVWQAKFFALLCRSSQSAMEFFKLPPNRVIELGTQIEV